MKDSEDAIERVLAGLRDADAPAGMERRILDGLEDRGAASTTISWRRLRPMWMAMPMGSVAMRSLAWGVVAAGVLAAVFAVPAMRRFGHSPITSKKNSAPVASMPITSPILTANKAESFPRQSGVRSETKANAPETRVIRAAASSESDEAAAMNDMRAASVPAPPMPLTEQERLLLRIVHEGDPVEMAMLDPKQRSLQEMKENAEYQRFFARPPIEQAAPEQPTQEQPTPETVTPDQPTTQQIAPEQSKNGR
jgi:hypothetical protein